MGRTQVLSSFEQLDYDMTPTPAQLLEIHNNGFRGVCASRSTFYYVRTRLPRFYTLFKGSQAQGAGRVSAPYKAALALDSQFGTYEAQTTGDCVSHSTRNAGTIDYSVDALFGETSFEGRLATENIYGHRGHSGQGADCARLAYYVSQEGPGGFLPRKNYEDGRNSIDLSVYNSRTGHNWGRGGTPKWLSDIATQNKALRVFSIKSIEEARDTIAMGFGISMCSSYGFASTRNEDGVAKHKGTWHHAMAWIGVDDTDWAHQNYGGPLFLVQNSWGQWNSGGKRHDQPDGSFWIEPRVAKAMIQGGGGWGIASVRGYNRELVYDMAGKVASL